MFLVTCVFVRLLTGTVGSMSVGGLGRLHGASGRLRLISVLGREAGLHK